MKRAILGLLAVAAVLAAPARADWLSAQQGTVDVPLAFPYQGKPVAGNFPVVLPYDLTFPANLGATPAGNSSSCKFLTNATADTAFTLKDNSTTKATITVGAGTGTCTFSTQAAFTITAGHAINLVAPSADATLADGGITLVGYRK